MRKIAYIPLSSPPERFVDYSAYKELFGYDNSYQFYGAFYKGQQVGYGATKEGEIVHVSSMDPEVDHGLEEFMQQYGNSAIIATKKGKEPKDQLNAPIPFIYDVHKKHIQIGYEGEHCRDIQPYRGEFSPGGIVEGEYQPGGKMLIFPSNTALYTTRSIINTWTQQFPQMEVTGLELDTGDGKTHKVANQMDPGQYIRVLTSADPAAANAYEALKFAGGKVYVVGGAVRDVLRGDNPKDIDLMVAGIPAEEVENILSKLPGQVKLTGKTFGVYRYRTDGHEVEVALPRQDKYESAQRGKGIITVDHNLPLEKDLERRDFTVNSMAVDLDTGELIDPYGGQSDIENNKLRTTHPDSFREDPTRLVRALSAHSRFGLHPDKTTRNEMASSAHLLRGESPDTLNGQLDKLFGSSNPAAAIRLGHETGVLKHLFPEVDDNWDYDQNNPHHEHKLGEHLMQVLDHTSQLTTDPDVRMAAMLHDIGKPASEWRDPVTGHNHFYEKHLPGGQVLGADHEKVGAKLADQLLSQRFNYPKARINRVTHLINHHMFPQFDSQKGARKFINRVGDQHADDLLHLREADMGGKGVTTQGDTPVQNMRTLVDEVRKGQQPTDLNNLAINGNDLLSLGMQPGPQVGQVLRNLLEHVMEVPTDNNHQALMQLAQGYIK